MHRPALAKKTAALAKLTRPRLFAATPRQRLFDLLDEHRKHPLIWIVGPPGAGKTTLVASYLDVRKPPALWCQIDSGDSDPATFFYYLRQAALGLTRKKQPALPLLTPEYLPDLPGFTRRWFRELSTLLPRKAVLVLDNYQEVGAGSALHALLRLAVDEIPAGVTLLLISRTEPPAEFAPLMASQSLARIGWDDLRLSFEESSAVAAAKQPVDEAVLRALHEQCDGWAAGVILMLERFRQTGMVNEIARGEAMETVFNYFAGLIFKQVSKPDQQVLMRGAFLPHLTAAMAEAISGDANAGKLLHDLHRRRLFIDRRHLSIDQRHLSIDQRSGREPVYQFHALFRAFLLARAKDVHTPAELTRLAQYAAVLLEADHQTEAAVDLLCQAADWDGVARIALHGAANLLTQGRHNVLIGWLESLPAAAFERDAWLCYWRGCACLPIHPAQTVRWCERAFALFKSSGERAGLLLSWSRIIQAIRFDPRGNVKHMDPWIAVADELLAEDASFPSEDIEYQFAYGIYVALQHRMPRHPRYNAWKDRAVALGLSATDSGSRAYLAYLAVSYETQRGHLVQAKLLLDAVSRVRDLSALARSFSYLGRIIYEVEAGLLDGALDTMAGGLGDAKNSGIHTWDIFLRWHGGRAALMQNNIALAESLRDDMAANADVSSGVPGSYYNYLAGLIALSQGHLPGAAAHAQIAVEISAASGWLLTEARCRHLLSRVLQETGALTAAKAELAGMFDLADRLDNRVLLSQGLVQAALLALTDGDDIAGCAALSKGLRLARELNLKQTLWLCPSDGGRLCRLALEARIEADFVRQVIGQCRVTPASPDIENWPWPLKIYTLGKFELQADGEPVTFSRKAPRKTIALLKAIIAFGGSEVSIQRLTDALWPELEGDAAQQAFAIALHRLRKLVRVAEAIQLQEGGVSLDPARCWIDASAFERLSDEAEAQWRQGADGAAMQVTEQALRVHGGTFLPVDADLPWTVSMRERLRGRFVHLVSRYARCLTEAGRHELAIDCYLRGLAVDDLAEALYQGLMRCYQETGRRAEALAIYRRLRQNLSVSLGVGPSATSEALHRALRSD